MSAAAKVKPGKLARLAAFSVKSYKRTNAYVIRKWPIFKKFAAVELTPPTPVEIVKGVGQGAALLKNLAAGGWKEATLTQATIGFFCCWEVLMWFFAGEVIGRRSLRGYKIDGAVYYKFKPIYGNKDHVAYDQWPIKPEPEIPSLD